MCEGAQMRQTCVGDAAEAEVQLFERAHGLTLRQLLEKRVIHPVLLQSVIATPHIWLNVRWHQWAVYRVAVALSEQRLPHSAAASVSAPRDRNGSLL